MTKDYIKQDIAHLLETITEQLENIYAHENKIPQIELDIILNNVRNLYEQFYALNKLNSRSDNIIASVNPAKTLTGGVISNEILPENQPTEIDNATTKNVNEKIEDTVLPISSASINEQIEIAASNAVEEHVAVAPVTIKVELTNPHPIPEPKTNVQQEVALKAGEKEDKQTVKKFSKTAASLFDAPASLGDQFDDAKTVKEKFTTGKSEKSIADKMHHQKIDDLRKAIGINEKFLFINELFEGSLASYNEHIEKLNTSADINHALSIIDSLIAKYNWDHEQEIVKKFKDLIQRRFV